jgi:hypothetical protein
MNRRLSALILGLMLGLGALSSPALAQKAKEPTDGFFDIPVDPNAVESPSYGVPAYMITSALGGLAMFILCKSARRG